MTKKKKNLLPKKKKQMARPNQYGGRPHDARLRGMPPPIQDLADLLKLPPDPADIERETAMPWDRPKMTP